MSKNTSISLGPYFDQFVKGRISEGRFKNASEVIRAGLRLLEDEETRVRNLKVAIREGVESGFVSDFDPDKNLKQLKKVKGNLVAKYTLSRKALQDLNGIWNYTIETWSERQADLYYFKIINQIKVISEKPELGRNYDEILNQLLGIGIGKHVIFYRINNEKNIQVVRILHAQMDLKNRMLDR